MATATVEIDQALLGTLQTEAQTQGLSLEALLRKLVANGAANHTQTAESEQPLENMNTTIGERLQKLGLLGAIDSSQPADPDSPPQRDAFFYLIAEELEKQGYKL